MHYCFMGQNLFIYIAVVLGEAVFCKVLKMDSAKRKRHLPVCDRTARAVENCLCPVSHTMSVNVFPTLRRTAVGPSGDVCFVLQLY